MRLREHTITLRGERVVLRPMTEDDWHILMKWNNDPDVIYFSDGGNSTSHTLKQVQHIYRSVSQNAYCFIIEKEDSPIGECWLQKMNLQRILDKYPGKDCRRIDLMIGEKSLWGQGLGTEVIGLLTCFGFEVEKADFIFGCDIADYNPRSLRAFGKVGYHIESKIEQPPAEKAHFCYDVVLSKDDYGAVKMITEANKPDITGTFTLDHVGMSVSNLDRSIEFYKQNFGFSVQRIIELPQRNLRVALLQKAAFTIEMLQFTGALPLPNYRKTTESDLNTIGVKHFCMRVNDIQSASDFLKRNGVKFDSEVTVGVRGLRRFFVKDPDGILVELTEGPK